MSRFPISKDQIKGTDKMSIPAYFILWKDGKRVTYEYAGIPRDTVPANASYGTIDGLAHIESWLSVLKEEYDFDGITSSLDGKTYYLTGEGLFANEVIPDD
jgi:hypothetical protein